MNPPARIDVFPNPGPRNPRPAPPVKPPTPRQALLHRLRILPAVLTSLAACSHAALEVDFVTPLGTVTAQLDYLRAPKASANLVTLAEGTRAWVDPTSGAVRHTPFFAGLTFHRVSNTPTAKFAETGSPTATGTDGPGYAFPDEFDPALTHQPYVLAMANDGPNTNGSRICLTGNLALPDRNGTHSVFGTVPGAPGRAVIDAILAAPPGSIAITAVNVRRTDPAALTFNPHAVGLPTVQALSPALTVVPGVSTTAAVQQPAATVLQAHAAADLAAWAPHFRSFVAADDPPPGPARLIDSAALPRRFYQFSLVSSPASLGPSGFANRTLTIEGSGFDTLIYQFNASGLGGTYQNIVLGLPFYEGSFVVRNEIPAVLGPYSFSVLLHLFDEPLGGSPFNHIRGGFDTAAPNSLSGRHLTTLLSPTMTPVFDDRGPLTLSRP